MVSPPVFQRTSETLGFVRWLETCLTSQNLADLPSSGEAEEAFGCDLSPSELNIDGEDDGDKRLVYG